MSYVHQFTFFLVGKEDMQWLYIFSTIISSEGNWT